jgi:hypothetical protein
MRIDGLLIGEKMKFELDQNEAQFIVQVIGNLPTQSGAHPLWQKLVAQFNEQVPKPEVQE